MKVERVSYRVMTPSAARGILSAIFWKPEFNWVIQKIHVLNPIKHISIRRNEVKSKISAGSIKKWMENNEHDRYYADQDRTQRNTLALRDVAYIIEANIKLKDHAKNVHLAKYRDQFRRRVNKGKCYKRPYLGNREFSAFFSPVDGSEKLIDLSDPLGRMLFDLNYNIDEERAIPVFFNAEIKDGTLNVPVEKYQEVWRNV
ncbi:MAG: type I-C CRISPR-associated protein Cas5c [Halanaerobiales bacterium]